MSTSVFTKWRQTELAHRIRSYVADHYPGYDFEVTVERVASESFVVRSNLICGLPPALYHKRKERRAASDSARAIKMHTLYS